MSTRFALGVIVSIVPTGAEHHHLVVRGSADASVK
jgi:hypothetical protein